MHSKQAKNNLLRKFANGTRILGTQNMPGEWKSIIGQRASFSADTQNCWGG